MVIHNNIEDVVLFLVNDIFDQEEREKKQGYCTCYQCRLDVACYALNRAQPEYVLSQRGVAHSEQDYQEKIQMSADLVKLVRDGISRIATQKRPHFDHDAKIDKPKLPTPPVFNFPTILGRVFNGNNFEPIIDNKVSLFIDGNLVTMIDPNWQNPYSLVSSTAGTFLFWPYPEKAEKLGLMREFEFEINAKVPGFEELQHFFSLSLVSEPEVIDSFSTQRTHKLPDLTIFPK